MTTMLYIRDDNMFTLGYLLQNILKNAEFLKNAQEQNISVDMSKQLEIVETVKYSTLIVGALPGMLIMPFFQKYFQKGMVIGSIKG